MPSTARLLPRLVLLIVLAFALAAPASPSLGGPVFAEQGSSLNTTAAPTSTSPTSAPST